MKTIFLGICSLLAIPIFAQNISGTIVDDHGHEVIGANVYWLKTTTGTTTDSEGNYTLQITNELPQKLVVSFVGFVTDTLTITKKGKQPELLFKETIHLSEVEISGKTASTKMDLMSSINAEEITGAELTKAACCNLSESFETNASVDVVYADAVSGAKKIQMLGLDGVYTQLMFENIPNQRGLGSLYGLSYVPGTWIDAIQITKGTGSVVNGYEPISGQINLEYLKPDDKDQRLKLNLYRNSNMRSEVNLHKAQKINAKWSTMLFGHYSRMQINHDQNHDGFLDNPKYDQVNVFNRWKNVTKRRMSQFGFRYLYDNKLSGQEGFKKPEHQFGNELFGIGILSRQAEVFGKTGFLMPNHPTKSIGLLANAKTQNIHSFFGNKTYSGNQNSIYFNGIYQTGIITSDNTLKLGVSFTGDEYDESYNDSLYSRTELVPGAFAEYTYSIPKKVSLVLGVRNDYHSLFGNKVSPRAHFKWNFSPQSAFRLTAGKGFRVPNVIAENQTVLASSRELIVHDKLTPEEAINTGATLSHKFAIGATEVSFLTDYYYTYFQNQTVVDLDHSAQEVNMYQLNGRSYSHSWQTELGLEILEVLSVKLAYKYYDVKTSYLHGLDSKPLVAKNRGLVNISYEPVHERWQMNVTTKLFGQSRLPNTQQNPEEYQLNEFSNPYLTVNAQVNRRFKKWEYYIGVENLLNYKQPNAILGANDPFSQYFDASMIWGPVNGIILYGGLDISIGKK